MIPLGIGIDLVEVVRIRRLLTDHGDRFKERTFTQAEMAYCDSCADPSMHYAARFAAKEAAAKALGTGIWAEGVTWTDLEITRDANGKPGLLFHNRAAVHAEMQGVQASLVSLTHTADQAAAQVMLLGQNPT